MIGVSLQDQQRAFEDLYNRSQHSVEVAAIILEVWNNFSVYIRFFVINAVSFNGQTVIAVLK